MSKKVFITGVSGYLGGALCRLLEHEPWCDEVYGVDVKRPLHKFDKLTFRRMDINDRALGEWIAEVAPDMLVHLAFIVDPIPDEDLMDRVNVDGTRNTLAAAAASRVPKIMVASSGTAYGAWPDNPVPLMEDDPIRPHPTFRYANQKSRVEQMCEQYAAEHHGVVVSWVRPCVVYGPLVNNYLSKLLTGLPVATGVRGFDPPLQFVHEEDVARAVATILVKDGAGPFNVAPDDSMSMSELMELVPKPKLIVPDWSLELLASVTWKLGISPLGAPPAILDFLRYPWVMDNSRLRKELGFTFKYSTRETLVCMLRAKGLAIEEERAIG